VADEVSKTGVFIDSKTGKVVNSQPEEGIQLVPPGGTIDPSTAAAIEAAKAAASGEASEPKTVTTAAAKGRA
jgi:hypothetical protein